MVNVKFSLRHFLAVEVALGSALLPHSRKVKGSNQAPFSLENVSGSSKRRRQLGVAKLWNA